MFVYVLNLVYQHCIDPKRTKQTRTTRLFSVKLIGFI